MDRQIEPLQRETLMAALRTREDFLTGILGSLESFVTVDADWRLTFVNAAALKVANMSEDDLLGQDLRRLAAAEFPGFDFAPLERAMAEERVIEFEAATAQRALVLACTAYPLADGGLAIYGRDITERERERDASRSSEERYRALFQAESDALLLIEHQSGRILEANEAAQELYGYSAEEFLELLDVDITADASLTKATARAAKVGETLTVPLRMHKRKDGTTFPVELKGRVFELGGRLVRVAAVRDISERRQAEEALRKSEERLQLAAEAAGIGTFDWDIETGVNIWSPELEAMYGLAPGEFGATQPAWEQLVHEEDRAAAVALVESTLETGLPVEGQWRVVWPDGSVHWISGRFRGLKDESGRPLRLIGANVDITSIIEAQSALRESEERYRTIVETTSEGVSIGAPDGSIRFANRRLADMLGYSVEELVGMSGLEIVSEDELDTVMKARGELRVGHVQARPLRMRRKDGSPLWTRYSASPLLDSDGNHLGNVVMHLDISEERRAEEALRESEKKYRAIVEGTAEGILVARPDGSITFANQRMADMLGYDRDEIIGKTALDLVFDDWRQAALEARAEVGAQKHVQSEFRWRRKDGAELWTFFSGTALLDDAGEHVATVYLHTDLTERRRAEEALLESQERLGLAVEANGLGIQDYDVRSDTVSWDRRVREIWGVGEDEEVSYETFLSGVHPDDREAMLTAVEAATDPAGPGRGTATYRVISRADGRTRWVRATWRVFFADGGAARIVGTIEDVTSQVETQEALRERHAERAAQEERRRIASDLHDLVRQSLFAASLKGEALAIATSEEAPRIREAVDDVVRLNRGALAQMRILLLELRGQPVEEVPLRQLLRNVSEAAESRASVKVLLGFDEDLALPPTVHEAVYRITQEALNNVVRHAKAENAWVQLRADNGGGVRLVIGDDGQGFDPALPQGGHFGLEMMRERAAETGGELQIASSADDGTVVMIDWREA